MLGSRRKSVCGEGSVVHSFLGQREELPSYLPLPAVRAGKVLLCCDWFKWCHYEKSWLVCSIEWVMKSVSSTRCPDRSRLLVSATFLHSCNSECHVCNYDSKSRPFGRLREQLPKHKHFAYFENCRCLGVKNPDYQDRWFWWWWWHSCHKPLSCKRWIPRRIWTSHCMS